MRYWVIILLISLVIAGIVYTEKTGMFIAAKVVLENESESETPEPERLKCKPNFIYLMPVMEFLESVENECKGKCYYFYRVTSFELREGEYEFFNCYCDVNNCNPR